jgi:NitT/TauT family transport system permease protein
VISSAAARRLVSSTSGSDSARVRRVNVVGWLFVVFVALLVEVGVRAFDYGQSIATPSSTLRALYEELADGTLSGRIGFTLEAYVEGLSVAIVIGVTAGILIGASRTLLDASSVLVEFLRPIPAVALIPLAILFFGVSGIAAERFVVAFAAVWPILINTIYGVRGVDHMLHDVARTSGVGGAGRLFRVTLPASLPSIVTGIQVSAAIALVVCVTAEFLTGAGGVGDYMEDQRVALRTPELYAAVVLVALLGYAVNVGLRAVQRRALFWAGEERSAR